MAEKNIYFNPHFEPFFESKNRYVVLYGSAGSGKSHSIAQKIVERCTHNDERHKFLVVRKFRTTLEGSVFTLIKSIISDFGLMPYVSINNTKMQFQFKNGNEIWCSGLDDPEKVKSIHGITSIWCEEATELEEGDFQQLDLRLRGETDSYKQIYISFNPISMDNWVHKAFFEVEVDDCFRLHSTYKHNLFLDKEYIKVLESRFEHDPNMKRIYVDGEWGRESTGSEFYSMFNKDVNVAPVKYNPEAPIHMSFDFNINPYFPISLWQIRTEEMFGGKLRYHVECFDLLALESPFNNTEEACKEFIIRYPNYDVGVFIYGDASGRVRTTTSQVHNYYIIENTLNKHVRNWSWRVPRKNPRIDKRRDFVNKILANGYEDIRLTIDPTCELMITDLENVLTDPAGKKWVKKAKNKAGVPYEKYGHFSDTLDYLLCSAFEDRFKDFGRKL